MSWYTKVGLCRPLAHRDHVHRSFLRTGQTVDMRIHYDMDSWYRTMAQTHE